MYVYIWEMIILRPHISNIIKIGNKVIFKKFFFFFLFSKINFSVKSSTSKNDFVDWTDKEETTKKMEEERIKQEFYQSKIFLSYCVQVFF